MMEYGSLYDSFIKEKPWNSHDNNAVFKQALPDYQCPSDHREKEDCFTDYIALIGPGTAWHEDGPVKLSDLPDGGSHTVAVVEVVDSGVHWAEPRDLAVEEALEGLKTGKGLRISTAHPSVINVLLADGVVRALPARMPFSLWKKILDGEATDWDNFDESAPDMVDVSIAPPEPGKWLIILSLIVWLFSVALLFRRAVKSRRKPVIAEAISAA